MIGAALVILAVMIGSIWCFLAFQPKTGDLQRLKTFNRQVLFVVGPLYLLMLGGFYLRIDDSEAIIAVALASALLFVPLCLALAAIYRARALSHPHSNGQSTV